LQVSIFAMGIMPYITASIITQLLRVVIPHFETLHKEGQAGQAKLTQYTRYLTIALALLQGTTLVTLARTGSLFPSCSLPLVPDDSLIVILLMVITLTAGTGLIMWMGELITERGIGNGMSILIFISIASGFPSSMGSILQAQGVMTFIGVLLIGVLIVGLVVFVEQSQRRIPVQYAKRTVGRRTVGGTSTYIPLKLNMANVIPVIFASSILALPQMLVQFNQNDDGTLPGWAMWLQEHSSTSSPWYMLAYTLMIIGFAYFYVAITFNPVEVADNMKKYGGFIPGIRAGRPTAEYLQYVISRITLPGALYLAFVALIPLIAFVLFNADQSFPFGGTSILIMVGVGAPIPKSNKQFAR